MKQNLCHECKFFCYEDVRRWPEGHCSKKDFLVNGLKIISYRLRPVSKKRECTDYDPHESEDGGFPLTMEEYSVAHFEWDGD
jgi:hypothetical protein